MIIGIDRASVDSGTCDWQRARAAGCTFAFLRATYGTKPDPAFAVEFPKLIAAGIVGGAYMFWRLGEKDEDQIKTFLDTWMSTILLLDGRVPTKEENERAKTACGFPPVIDVEFPKGLTGGATPRKVVDRLVGLVWSVRERLSVSPLQTMPMLYTSARVWREDLKDVQLTGEAAVLFECPLWLARYAGAQGQPWKPPATDIKDPQDPRRWAEHEPGQHWWVHQYAGDATGFPGFSKTVDMNRFSALHRGDRGARVAWTQRKLLAGRARQEPALIAKDAIFDQATEDQVRRYQTAAGLVSDGIVGPRTFARLCWEG